MADRVERTDERIQVRDDLTLHVVRWSPREEPVAPPFLLVHGLSSNARLWDGVGRRLAESGHLAVAVDERGHGLSDKPDGGYDSATIDEDLTLLIGRLGLDRPIVAGQSWGGGVALDLAVRSPELLAGIVLIDGHVWDFQDDFASFDEVWEKLAPPRVAGSPLHGVRRWFHSQHPSWSDEAIEASLGNFEHRPDGTVDLWLTRDRHREILRAMWDQQPSRLWAQLRVPMLAIAAETGDTDWTAKKHRAMELADRELMVNRVPHEVRFVKADHDVHAQYPDLVADVMLGALARSLFAHQAASNSPPPTAGAQAETILPPNPVP